MVRVIVVEDDERLNKVITSFIKQNGFEVGAFLDATAALADIEEHPFDIVISDIMMPGIDGFAFANMVRLSYPDVPILFMSARDDSLSKEKGFRIGIDDYLVKPVNPEELIWRLEAIMRRANITSSDQLNVGGFTMDKKGYTAANNGTDLPLTTREFNILYKLLSYPEQAFSRAQLMDEFWGFESDSTLRSVDVYITKLRDKLSVVTDFQIKTVYGVGYKVVVK